MKLWTSMCCLLLAGSAMAQSAVDLVDGELTAEQILADLEGLNEEIEQINTLGSMEPRLYATIRFLDRLHGEVVELQLERNDSLEHQFITVTLKNCFVPRGNPTSDAAAYLVVQDKRETVPAFEGWMIASSPALSALDHPRYDVWVVSCADEGISAVSSEGVAVPPERDPASFNAVEGIDPNADIVPIDGAQ